MKSKVFIGIIIVIGVLAVIVVVKGLQFKVMGDAQKNMPLQVSTIASATATNEDWQDTLPAIGSVTAAQGVLVSPEVAGMVSEIDFDSGAVVKKGDLLIRLDTTSEEAQLRAAQAATASSSRIKPSPSRTTIPRRPP
jgi:membrane fusion protein, multidrug efflux system